MDYFLHCDKEAYLIDFFFFGGGGSKGVNGEGCDIIMYCHKKINDFGFQIHHIPVYIYAKFHVSLFD